MTTKLHLGCGGNYLSGWLNIDHESSLADLHVDLSVLPWPWESDSISEVRMDHILEHFERPEAILREVHRVLEPNGLITVTAPHAESVTAHHIDHRSFLSRFFFRGFSAKSPHYWVRRNNCMFQEISYHVQLLNFGPVRWTPLDPLASKFPVFWEKISFGPFRPTEITWIARKAAP
jgi:predicted SAM-dependent methyltransferase